MNAGLRFGWVENELRLAAFLSDGVVALDGHLSEGIAIRCYAIAKYSVIDRIDGCEGRNCRRERNDKRAL
jgi:hypothetical protein